MRNLIRTELFKIFRQRKTYYAIAAVFVLEAFIMVSAFFQGREFLDVFLENLRETFEFQGNLLNGNLIIYLVLNSFWFHIPLILMIVVSGFLTGEYKDRTVEAILLQPVSKRDYIISKYIAAVVFTAFILGILIVSTFLLSYLFFGRGDLVVFLEGLSFYNGTEAFYRLLIAFLIGSLTMFFYAVVSITLAVLFQEATVTWIVAALFLIGTTLMLRFEFESAWVNGLFFPKLTDSWQYVFFSEIPYGKIINKSVVLIGYTGLFAWIGIRVFQKRDIS
ncbi:MAG: ABC transporter permease [Robiginitalea sp.]|uniref:ABC transporter permease n=1 Tax=Robiginitalea sp. TaxID=1902411 RepID=UPI003C73AA1B